MTYRVVQWTTGKVAAQSLRATLAHADLELVGVYAYSKDKVGRDAGVLCGLDPIGVAATDDVDALLALKPDCVIYNPLYPNPAELVRILEAGVNIVTTSAFITGSSLGAAHRDAIDAAARRGGASIFGSGINPGFANLLTAMAAGICRRFRHVLMIEAVEMSLFAGDANMDEVGLGLPANSPGHAERMREATKVFGECVELIADLLDITLDDIRCTTEFAHATAALDIPGRPIAAGTVAGVKIRWQGFVGSQAVIELRQIWVLGNQLEPLWPYQRGYTIEVDGEPNVHMKLGTAPYQKGAALTKDDLHSIGMIVTSLPAVNAIAAVCAAEPGIRTYRDLPLITGRGRLQLD